MSADPLLPRVHHHPDNTEVFNCHIYVRRDPASAGKVTARMATLADFSVIAATEREALQTLVRQAKALFAEHQASGQPIPWLAEPLARESDEAERWMAVHL